MHHRDTECAEVAQRNREPGKKLSLHDLMIE
jgi:hypothetical protein